MFLHEKIHIISIHPSNILNILNTFWYGLWVNNSFNKIHKSINQNYQINDDR